MNTEHLLERLARVEGRVEEHSRMAADIAGRFTNIEGRFDRMETSLGVRFERVDARLDHIDAKMDLFRGEVTRYFTWMIGVILASWLTLMYRH